MSALPSTGPIVVPALPPAAAARPADAPVVLPLAGRRMLLVASSGGHLTELVRLADRWPVAAGSRWVTFDTPQTRTVLDGRQTDFVPYVAPRDLLGALRSVLALVRIVRRGHYDEVVSTGAAIAVSAFIAARLQRVPALYVESVARVDAPSLTGRIVSALRLATTRTQHKRWAGRRWAVEESVLTAFASRPRPIVGHRPLRVFVTLGTIRPYRFDAVVDAVLRTGLCDESTVWQLGCTTRDDLPGRVVQHLGHDEFLAATRNADVVVTHAGVGTVLELLEAGVHPVVVARTAGRGEHVDDHQAEIARYIQSIGVAEVLTPEALTAEALRGAARLTTVPAR